MTHRIGAGVLLIAGALLLAACGGGGADMGASGGSHSTHIVISNYMFAPMSDTVSPGATISVTNKDSATHTLSATGGQFDTGDIKDNQTRTFKAPTKPGIYSYICGIHQYMKGTIVVK